MNQRLSDKFKNSQIFKKLLNNRFALFLIILLLVFLNIFILTRIAFIFTPVVIALEIIGPPLIVAGIAYYLINPMVNWIEKRGAPRQLAIIIIFVLIALLIGIGIYFVVPVVQSQIDEMILSFPYYWNQTVSFLNNLVNTDSFSEFMSSIQPQEIINSMTSQGTGLFSATLGGIGSVIGTVAQVVITIFTAPIIVYYILIDGNKIPERILQYTPTGWRRGISDFLTNANDQLGYYVRGQLIVSFFVAIMFWLGFSIIGLNYALTLAIVAGALNLVPYLGSIISAGIALLIGLVTSPWMFLSVIIVIAIEQFLEGRIVQPLVLGNQLQIHPVTIIFILLIGGRLFGVLGVLLTIPGYAVIKIIIYMAFEYIHSNYDFYHDEEPSPVNTDKIILDRNEIK